jgi:hypothetical protein
VVHFLSFSDCLRSYLLELGFSSYVRIFELLSSMSYYGNLSNTTLVLLGVRALTEEEQLYLRLSSLGKYFSTGEEICTY